MRNELEIKVREILRTLEAKGFGRFWKMPTDLRLAKDKKGSDLKIVHGEPMPADFFGWKNGGQACLIECKDVDRLRLPFGKSPGLSPFQVQAMKNANLEQVPYLVIWKRQKQFVMFGGFPVGKSIAWSSFTAPWHVDELPERLGAFIMNGWPPTAASATPGRSSRCSELAE